MPEDHRLYPRLEGDSRVNFWRTTPQDPGPYPVPMGHFTRDLAGRGTAWDVVLAIDIIGAGLAEVCPPLVVGDG